MSFVRKSKEITSVTIAWWLYTSVITIFFWKFSICWIQFSLFFVKRIIKLHSFIFIIMLVSFICLIKHSISVLIKLFITLGIVVACYVHVKFMSGSGQPLLLAIINSFVHTIMYGYYFITSFKPELKQSIWWKKHITQVQLVRIQYFIKLS